MALLLNGHQAIPHQRPSVKTEQTKYSNNLPLNIRSHILWPFNQLDRVWKHKVQKSIQNVVERLKTYIAINVSASTWQPSSFLLR